MKYAHIIDNKLMGWYSDDIHTNIPTPNIEVTDEVWQEAININANCYEDGKFIVKDFRTDEEIEEAEAVYETVVVTPAIEASTRTVYNKLEEFNHSALYNEDERGYVSIYKSLTEKYGGIKI